MSFSLVSKVLLDNTRGSNPVYITAPSRSFTPNKYIYITPQKMYDLTYIRCNHYSLQCKKKKKWDLRSSRRAKKRIFFKRLKRKPPQKASKTGERILRTIIHVHCYQKQYHIHHHKWRNNPCGPPFKRPEFCFRRRWAGHFRTFSRNTQKYFPERNHGLIIQIYGGEWKPF